MTKGIRLSRYARGFLLAVLGSFVLVACGGGGGGSSGGSTSTGSVSVLVTDLPTADYCEINITITEVILIGDAGQTTLYSNAAGKTLNLLDLAHHSEVFSHTHGVPAGDYSKIRLVLDGGVQLKPANADDTCAEPSTWIDARVPSSKIDLNPQGEFTVAPDGVLVVELDMDAKAFKLVKAGASGQYLVRPVVFVNVMTSAAEGKLVRLFGTVANNTPAAEGGRFELCKTEIAWRDDDDDDDEEQRCVEVNVLTDTSVFDETGDPASYVDAVANDKMATVIARVAVGEMDAAGDDDADEGPGDDDSDQRIVLNAEVIELGVKTTYGRYTGIVKSVPSDALDSFDFDFEPPQGFELGTVIPVQLQEGTKIFSRTGEALAIADFAVGQNAKVEGVLAVGESDFIKSSVVWLDVDEDRMACEGTVDPATVQLTEPGTFEFVANAPCWTDQVDYVVEVAPGAAIVLVSEEGAVIEHITLEAMADLSGTYAAQVYGTAQADGTILSDRIILQQSS